ncbi:MAG: AraC family transcriptional regulator [Planctomycetota bacterium]|nr:AraC family transcriptional regulator [Planctomycetota bacterium]
MVMVPNLWSNFALHFLNIDRCRCNTGWRYNNVSSPFTRLILTLGGEAHITHHEKKYVLRPSKMHLIPCFTSCTYFRPDWFEFLREIALFERLLELNPDCPFCVYRKISQRLQRFSGKQLNVAIFERDNGVKIAHNPGEIVETDGIVRQLLAPILKTAHEYSDKSKYHAIQQFKDVLDFIDSNLHKPITLDDMANVCYLSPVYFSNLFLEKLGVRPIQYLNLKRIQKAQTSLMCTNKTITEISEEVGFNETNYFCRVFKKYVGISPAKYRTEK